MKGEEEVTANPRVGAAGLTNEKDILAHDGAGVMCSLTKIAFCSDAGWGRVFPVPVR